MSENAKNPINVGQEPTADPSNSPPHHRQLFPHKFTESECKDQGGWRCCHTLCCLQSNKESDWKCTYCGRRRCANCYKSDTKLEREMIQCEKCQKEDRYCGDPYHRYYFTGKPQVSEEVKLEVKQMREGYGNFEARRRC